MHNVKYVGYGGRGFASFIGNMNSNQYDVYENTSSKLYNLNSPTQVLTPLTS